MHVFSQDVPTLALHLWLHANGIREEVQFCLEECSKGVTGNDRVTRPWGTTQSAWIYEISDSANEGWGTAAVCQLLGSQWIHGDEPISSHTDLGDAWQDLRNAYHLIEINAGDEYKTELQYQLEEISRQQNNDLRRDGWPYWRCRNDVPECTNQQRSPAAINAPREPGSAYLVNKQYTQLASRKW